VKNRDRIKACVLLIAGIAVWYIITKYLSGFVMLKFGKYFPKLLKLTLSSMLIPYLIAFPAFYLIVRKMPLKAPEISKYSCKHVIKAFIIQSGISIPVCVIITIIFKICGFSADTQFSAGLSQNYAFYLILLLVFNPIMEEIFFRKFVLQRLLPYGVTFAIIASSIMFAIPHAFSIGVPQMFYTFILGCVWAYMANKSGSLKPSIFLHALSNLWGSFLPLYLTKTPVGTGIYFVVWCILMPICAIILLVKMKKVRLKNAD